MNLITAAHLNLSERCLSLVNQIKNSSKDPNNNMAVPIAVLLCPLNAIENPKCEIIQFHEVDVRQVARSFRVWDKLDNLRVKADSIRSSVKVEYIALVFAASPTSSVNTKIS